MSLVRSAQPHDHDPDALRARAAALETSLGERAAGLDRMKADLAAFRLRYRDEVGELHEQLEALELSIAEIELGAINQRLEDSAAASSAVASAPAESAPRYTSDAVRRLFRDVAKTIHPDFADDEAARERRHRLMIEANRAYAMGDEERLRSILEAWEKSPEAVQGDDPASARERLLRRIAQLEADLAGCDRELAALQATSLWKLKAMVDEATKRGQNLVADTVRRLKRDILIAQNRLAALSQPPTSR